MVAVSWNRIHELRVEFIQQVNMIMSEGLAKH
jgi:hypothetical protein